MLMLILILENVQRNVYPHGSRFDANSLERNLVMHVKSLINVFVLNLTN